MPPPFFPSPSLFSRRRALHTLGALPMAWLGSASAAQGRDHEVLRPLFAPQLALCPEGPPLQLNGAGIRYKAMFRVYAAGLYLPQPAQNLEEVEQQTGCKRIAITMLRKIEATELGNLFIQGIHANSAPHLVQGLLPNMLRMGEVFARNKTLEPGQNFCLDRIPDKGMVLRVDDVAQPEPFEGPFFDALLRIWLGERPADRHLKAALLAASSRL